MTKTNNTPEDGGARELMLRRTGGDSWRRRTERARNGSKEKWKYKEAVVWGGGG